MQEIEVPDNLRKLVIEVHRPVTSEDVDVYGRMQAIEDLSRHYRILLRAWAKQQDQDREMRRKYATWLMLAMALQVVFIDVVYVLMGSGVLTVEPWTARTFIMAVFAEIAALVLWVVKYLFAPQALPQYGVLNTKEEPRGNRL